MSNIKTSTTQAGGYASGTISARTDNTTAAVKVEQSQNSFKVDGEESHIRPHTAERAEAGNASAIKDLRDNAGFELTLKPDTEYNLRASGSIEDGAWDFDEVDATDKTNYSHEEYTAGRYSYESKSRTAMQFSVEQPNGEVTMLDYKPGADGTMDIKPNEDGTLTYGDHTFEAGSKLRGHFLENGRAGNNDGSFKVDVTETTTKSAVVVTPEATRAEMEAVTPIIRETVEAPAITDSIRSTTELSTIPKASIPSPRLDLARQTSDKAISYDNSEGRIRTSGGYEFQLEDRSVTVIEPGKTQGTRFDFDEGKWYETDGTSGNLTPEMLEARWVNGDTSAFQFKTDRWGTVTGMTIAHDDARVDITGFNNGWAGATIHNKAGTGLAWRAEAFEDTSKITAYNGGYGELRGAGTDLQTGWYATQRGENLGWIRQYGGDNVADGLVRYNVDRNQRPPFGTEAYADALQNAIAQDLGETAGAFQNYGYTRRESYEAAYHYTQPNRDRLAEVGTLNEVARDYNYPSLLSLYGSTPTYYNSLPDSLDALREMQMLLALQRDVRPSFALPFRL